MIYGDTTQFHKHVSRFWRHEVFIDAYRLHYHLTTQQSFPMPLRSLDRATQASEVAFILINCSFDLLLLRQKVGGLRLGASSSVTFHISILLWTGHPREIHRNSKKSYTYKWSHVVTSGPKGQAATRNVLRRVGQMKSRKTFGEGSTVGTSTLHQTNRKGLWMFFLQICSKCFDSWHKEMLWTYLNVKNQLWTVIAWVALRVTAWLWNKQRLCPL